MLPIGDRILLKSHARGVASRLAVATFIAIVLISLCTMVPRAIAEITDPYEPDDTMETASLISTDGVPREQYYEGTWGWYHGHDWLKFEGTAGKVYEISLARGTVWSLPWPSVYLADGVLLPMETKGVDGVGYLFYCDTTGTHFIDLNQNSVETGTYYVSVLEGDPEDFDLTDEYEPDNTIRSAKAIPTDGTTQTRLHDGTDYVRFDAVAGRLYRLRVGWVAEGTYMVSIIVNSNDVGYIDEDLVSRTSGQTRYFVAPVDGPAYVKISKWSGESALYTLSVTELELSYLEGRVTLVPGGQPLAGVRVKVYEQAFAIEPACAQTVTREDGTWRCAVMPGRYGVGFDDPSGALLPEYYSGVIPPQVFTTPIVVAEESTVSGIDGRLWTRGRLEGRVVYAGTATPIAGVTVNLEQGTSSGYRQLASMTSASDGTFHFEQLDPRLTYYLTAIDPNGLVQLARIPFGVPADGTRTLDFPMTTPAYVKGRVTSAVTGAPLAGVSVEVYQGSGGYTPQIATALTAADGSYTATVTTSGRTKLYFNDRSNTYLAELWDDTYDLSNPTYFELALGQTYGGMDAALMPVDQLPPVTRADAPPAWANADVTVTLEATDTTGVECTYFSLDGSEPTTYTAPFEVLGDGIHPLAFWSVDTLGNVESVVETCVRIDKVDPSTECDAVEEYDDFAQITLRASDVGSGVDATFYRLDDGDAQEGDSLRVTEPGTHSLDFWSMDLAGNDDPTSTVTFSVTYSRAVEVEIAGVDRIATAVEASKHSFPSGADCVVVATARDWPDALGGAALAGALDGPILLVDPHSVPASVTAEITRLGATRAVILGGTAAVGVAVQDELDDMLSVTRLGGVTRYETARLIAAAAIVELGSRYDGTAFVATGVNFPDALSSSPLAASKGWPIYLVDPRVGVDAGLESAMRSDGVDRALILGGSGVLSDAIASELPVATTLRLAGTDRYRTALAVADYGVTTAGLSWDGVAITTGGNFPDALAGGVLQGRSGSVILLTRTDSLDPGAETALRMNKVDIDEVRFLGGTSAVSEAVRAAVMHALE